MKIAQISRYLSPSNSRIEPKINNSSSSSSSSTSSKFEELNLNATKDFEAFAAKKPIKKETTKETKISRYFETPKVKEKSAPASARSPFSCPICSLDLTRSEDNERQTHVNQCLDHGFSSKPKKFGSVEEATAVVNRREEKKPVKAVKSEPKETVAVVAVTELSKPAELSLNDLVPNCPICGKVLHSLNTRQTHMKKCAQVFHIKTESLMEMVRKQQEKIERDLAKGLMPDDVYVVKKKTGDGEAKPAKKSSRLIKMEQPASKQDEQLQMAIALSNSLNPAEDSHPQQPEIKLLKKDSKASNKKSKETVLMLCDDEQRQKVVSARLTEILDRQIRYEPRPPEYRLIDTRFDSTANYLWEKCRYFHDSDEAFYVQFFVDSGKFQVGNQVFIEKHTQERFADVELLNTQTALLMAELNEHTQENLSIYLTQVERSQSFAQSYFVSSTSGDEKEEPNEEEEEKAKFEEQSIEEHEKTNISKVDVEEREEENALDLSGEEEESNKEEDKEQISAGMSEADEEQDFRLKFICEDEDNQAELDEGESQGLNEGAICIEETLLSSSSCELNEEEEEESSSTQNQDSNILDQNMDVIEETSMVSERNCSLTCVRNCDEHERNCDELPELISVASSSNEPIFVVEEVAAGTNTKKRKSSIQLIQINDDEYEVHEKEETKKFRKDEGEWNDSLQIIGEWKERREEAGVGSERQKAEESQVLRMLEECEEKEKTLVVETNENNDDPLDEVWNNFGENQFEDFMVYSEPNNFDEVIESPPAKELRPSPRVASVEKTSSLTMKTPSPKITSKFIAQKSPTPKRTTPKSPEQIDEEYDAYDCTKTPRMENFKKKPSSKNPTSRVLNEEGSVTPMPGFANMDTPSLRDELKRFGVKALPKRQAVKKLVEIYEYTHRHKLKRSASCADLLSAGASSRLKKSVSSCALSVDDEIDLAARQMNLEKVDKAKGRKKMLKKTVSDVGFQGREESNESVKSLIKINSKAKKTRQEKSIDDEILALNSDESEAEESASQAAKTGRQKKSMEEDELRQFVYEFITSEQRIYLDVLNYVPLDFECMHASMQVAAAPRKINGKLLMKVLDEYCVTFTLKSLNTRGGGNSKVKSRKKH